MCWLLYGCRDSSLKVFTVAPLASGCDFVFRVFWAMTPATVQNPRLQRYVEAIEPRLNSNKQ